jgi:hypothetical protein
VFSFANWIPALLSEELPVQHDGRRGEATLEVCLAIHQSARERREVALSHQVAGPRREAQPV